MIELANKGIKQLIYSPYAQEFRGNHKHYEINGRYKKNHIELLEMKNNICIEK